MQSFYCVELSTIDNVDIIEPFLPMISFVESFSSIYIFQDYEDINFLTEQLEESNIIESFHSLYLLDDPIVSAVILDYGFQLPSGSIYLLKDIIAAFYIVGGQPEEIKMALLQFDEHLIAQDGKAYLVDLHQQALIEKIAKAYNIIVSFLDLDKMF